MKQNDLNFSASNVISTYTYRVGLQQADFGYSTAIGLFNTLINLVFLIGSNTLSLSGGQEPGPSRHGLGHDDSQRAAVLSVVTLYYAVGHWNDYYTALIYINDRKLIPLQSAMKDLMSSAQVLAAQITPLTSEGMMSVKAKMELAMSLKYTTIIASIIPMLIIYPMVQKHFVKGVMLGAIKG